MSVPTQLFNSSGNDASAVRGRNRLMAVEGPQETAVPASSSTTIATRAHSSRSRVFLPHAASLRAEPRN